MSDFSHLHIYLFVFLSFHKKGRSRVQLQIYQQMHHKSFPEKNPPPTHTHTQARHLKSNKESSSSLPLSHHNSLPYLKTTLSRSGSMISGQAEPWPLSLQMKHWLKLDCGMAPQMTERQVGWRSLKLQAKIMSLMCWK